MKRFVCLALASTALAGGARLAAADEGFWQPGRFPHQRVKDLYGISVDDAVLARAARSAVVIAGGGTGAFVSPGGLVVLKHGQVKPCLDELRAARATASRFAGLCEDRVLRAAVPLLDRLYCQPLERSAELNYVARGYLARTRDQEARCSNLTVDALVRVEDVSQTVWADLAAAPADRRAEATRAIQRRMQTSCERAANAGNKGVLLCRVISLYGGSRFERHTIHRYQDVRVVFAPESDVADLGDIRDHITFPDHDFKVAFVRVYDGGRPLATPDHFRWSGRRLREGELTLMVNHPGRTLRRAMPPRLVMEREIAALSLHTIAEVRGLLTEIGDRGQLALSLAVDLDAVDHNNLYSENRVSNLSFDLVARRTAEQRALLGALEQRRDPGLQELRAALAEANRALTDYAPQYDPLFYFLLENLANSQLIRAAVSVVLSAEGIPIQLQVPGFTPAIEARRLELALRKIASGLPSGHPALVKLLGDQTVTDRAASLTAQTQLAQTSFRRALVEGGRPLWKTARDPMLDVIRAVFPEMMASLRRRARIMQLSDRANDLLDAAAYRLHGLDVYPEGTSTVRVSFGALRRYADFGRVIEPFTTLGDFFRRSRPSGPYQIPQRWLDARDDMDLTVQLNLATDHDGSSGSAVLFDTTGDLVGLMFNGNRYHLGVAEAYEDVKRRTVSVHGAAVIEALREVYRAHELLRELGLAVPAHAARSP
jgi:hypothetical protein